jgi:hypothetical protein
MGAVAFFDLRFEMSEVSDSQISDFKSQIKNLKSKIKKRRRWGRPFFAATGQSNFLYQLIRLLRRR